MNFFSSKNDNSCTRGAWASDFVLTLYIYFILYVHFKKKQEPLTALGKGKQYREEINFIRKAAIAMQHGSSGNRCCLCTMKTWFTGVICQIHDLINWSRTPLQTEQIPQSLRACAFFVCSKALGLWPKVPLNICKACYEWTRQEHLRVWLCSEIWTLKDTQTRSSHLGWTLNNPRKESRDFSIRKGQTKLKILHYQWN